MLLIECPWCGPRDEIEFTYGGEAHRVRPRDPSTLSDAEWAGFLFMRTNTKGAHKERWNHSHGCRRWFNVERDTVSYRITKVYKMGGAEAEPVSAPDPAPVIAQAPAEDPAPNIIPLAKVGQGS
jgi:heterotetrameric sarcosine oxidase delta subunit